jgi:hypothetical protein
MDTLILTAHIVENGVDIASSMSSQTHKFSWYYKAPNNNNWIQLNGTNRYGSESYRIEVSLKDYSLIGKQVYFKT